MFSECVQCADKVTVMEIMWILDSTFKSVKLYQRTQTIIVKRDRQLRLYGSSKVFLNAMSRGLAPLCKNLPHMFHRSTGRSYLKMRFFSVCLAATASPWCTRRVEFVLTLLGSLWARPRWRFPSFLSLGSSQCSLSSVLFKANWLDCIFFCVLCVFKCFHFSYLCFTLFF